jgi:hypothetical protein
MSVDIDEELLKIVAAALTRGQDVWSVDELAAAYQEVFTDRVAGTLVELLFEGQVALRVNGEEEVQYTAVNFAGNKLSDAEIASAVEAFISSTATARRAIGLAPT